MSIIVTVERLSDGTVYEQEVPYQYSPEKSVEIFSRYLGKDYYIVDWRIE